MATEKSKPEFLSGKAVRGGSWVEKRVAGAGGGAIKEVEVGPRGAFLDKVEASLGQQEVCREKSGVDNEKKWKEEEEEEERRGGFL